MVLKFLVEIQVILEKMNRKIFAVLNVDSGPLLRVSCLPVITLENNNCIISPALIHSNLELCSSNKSVKKLLTLILISKRLWWHKVDKEFCTSAAYRAIGEVQPLQHQKCN